MKRGALLVAVALFGVVGSACSEPLPDEVSYQVHFRNPFPGTWTRVLLNGVEVFASAEERVDFDLVGPPYTEENPDGLGSWTLQLNAPWGPETLAVDVSPPLFYFHHRAAREAEPTELYVHDVVEELEHVLLFVDNRGRDRVELSMGAWSLTVPADDTLYGAPVPRPRDGDHGDLFVGERRAGTIPVQDTTSGSVAAVYVVDTSGRSRYQLQTVTYSRTGGFSSPPRPRRLRGGHLHSIGRVSPSRFFFLRTSPSTITIANTETIVTAYELTDDG